jgi:hypothetical protein
MQDIFAGLQGYDGLSERLLRNLHGSLREVAMNFLFRRALAPARS